MTNATGRSFLSYRRSRLSDARLLIEAQHEHGIPTWQDVHDLNEGPVNTELSEVLNEDFTANAVVWLTPEVASSPPIQRLELPKILDREAVGDGFFVVPVAAGGLRREDKNSIRTVQGTFLSTRSLEHWHLLQAADPFDATAAMQVAERVLRRRIKAVHRQLPPGEPLRVLLYTREKPPIVAGNALTIDWSHHLAERDASQTVWDAHLLPALRRVSDACRLEADGRAILADGKCEIPAAVALGTTYLEPRGLSIAWRQFTKGRATQDWSLDAAAEPSGFSAALEEADVAADDIAVLVSVASPVKPAFGASRDLPASFRGHILIERPGKYPHHLASASQARDVVQITVEALHLVRSKWQARGTLHLFLAGPVGLAMMLGQKLNTFGPIQTYRHDAAPGAVGVYRPAVRIPAA